MGLAMGTGVAVAETPELNSAETVVSSEVEEGRRFTAERIMERCERYLPACQPAVAYRSLEQRWFGLRALPLLRPVPVMQVDPRLSHSLTAMATGLMLRTARGVATDPLAIDPVRYFSPAQRTMVGIHTPSDQLGELAHPILGSNSFRPTPKATEDSKSD